MARGWAPPPDPRTGALLAKRRTAMVAARATRTERVAFGKERTHRHPDAVEPDREDVHCPDEPRPRGRRVRSLTAGIDRRSHGLRATPNMKQPA